MADVTTPNLKLKEVQAGRNNWSADMNQNLAILDAVVGAYFIIQDLQGVWQNSTVYEAGSVVDADAAVVYTCLVPHTSLPIPATFADERAQFPEYWGVYSTPARSRGVWMTHTTYALNDFVVSGSKYAICILTHTSDDDFETDLADGKWSVLVDLSTVGEAVLPVPGGAGDANKFAAVNSSGSGYTILSSMNALGILGATSIGIAVLQALSTSDALSAIGAQQAGSYQAGDTSLTALSGKTIGTFGLTLLACAAVENARTALGLGTSAVLDVGTSANKVVQLDASAKLPAVNASQLTNVPATTTAVTQAINDATTKIATDEFVDRAVGASAYATLSAGVITVRKSHGITSIVRDSQGLFTVTLSSAMPDLFYRVLLLASANSSVGLNRYGGEDVTVDRTTTVFHLYFNGDNTGNQDPISFSLEVRP